MANELKSLNEIFQYKLFRIPDYQRGYAWKESQLNDFWDDLLLLQEGKNHYTGMLSLKKYNTIDENKLGADSWLIKKYNAYYVIDGQQRLTTSIILINEIINFVKGLDENKDKRDDEIYLDTENLSDIISQYIYKQKPPLNVLKTYIFGYEEDNPSYLYLRHYIFNEPSSGHIEETYYTKNLQFAKNFFKEQIIQLYESEGLDGIESLYLKLTLHFQFNIHEIDEDYNVFVAFETMNNRGKRLTNLELLKNRLIYLTTLFKEDGYDIEDEETLRTLINDTWKDIYYYLGKNTTKVLIDDEFLRDHWIMYFKYSRQKGNDYIRFLLDKFSSNNIDGLHTHHKKIKEILHPNDINEYVRSLKNMAKHWYESYFPYESNQLTNEEKIWIEKLNRIEIAYFRPLITVAISQTHKYSLDDRIAFYKAVERIIFVLYRYGTYMSTYKNSYYNAKVKQLYHSEISLNDITNDLINETNNNLEYCNSLFINRMKNNFENYKGYYSWYSLKYFLFEYEDSLATHYKQQKIKAKDLFIQSEKDKISIEHILPQTLSNSYWKNQMRDYNSQEIQYLSGALGNLLPLLSSINSSLQNDSFPDKKHSDKRLYRGYENGCHSEIEVSRNENWNAQLIYERSLKLLQFMNIRWDLHLTDEQIKSLTYIEFVNDERTISDELEITEDMNGENLSYEDYWKYMLPILRETSGLFHNVTPTTDNYIMGYPGIAHVSICCRITQHNLKTELYIEFKKELTKKLYDYLYSLKETIEIKTGQSFIWDRSDNTKASKIYLEMKDTDFSNKNDWDKFSQFHSISAKIMLNTFEDYIRNYLDTL